jgi:hypothetical protein
VEHRDRVLLGLGLHDVEGAVDDRFGDRLLAVLHERVHELGDDEIAELGIRIDFTLFGA